MSKQSEFDAIPSTPAQQAAIEQLGRRVRAERAKASGVKQPPPISAADYLRGIERRRAFKQSVRPSAALLEFARLSDNDAERFRAKHPSYFPEDFWNRQLPSDEEPYQGSVFLSGQRPNRAARPFWQGYRDLLRAAWACAFANEYVIRLLNVAVKGDPAEDYIKPAMPAIRVRERRFDAVWPFQADILAVVRCGWPVRLCDWCGEPIFVLRPNVRFCPGRGPKSCYVEHRRYAKRLTWNRHKHVYRPSKTKRRRAAA